MSLQPEKVEEGNTIVIFDGWGSPGEPPQEPRGTRPEPDRPRPRTARPNGTRTLFERAVQGYRVDECHVADYIHGERGGGASLRA